jgi:hypothetical protein
VRAVVQEYRRSWASQLRAWDMLRWQMDVASGWRGACSAGSSLSSGACCRCPVAGRNAPLIKVEVFPLLLSLRVIPVWGQGMRGKPNSICRSSASSEGFGWWWSGHCWPWYSRAWRCLLACLDCLPRLLACAARPAIWPRLCM